MRKALTVRIGEENEASLGPTSQQTRLPRRQIVRDQAAGAQRRGRPFMRLAGVVDGALDLSRCKGFSRS